MKDRIKESSKEPSLWHKKTVLPRYLSNTMPESDINRQVCYENPKQCYTPSEHAKLHWSPELGRGVGLYEGGRYYNLKGFQIGGYINDPPIQSCFSPIDVIAGLIANKLIALTTMPLIESTAQKFAQEELFVYSTRPFAFNFVDSGIGEVVWATAHGPAEWLYKKGVWNSLIRAVRTGKWRPFPRGEEYIRKISGSSLEHFYQVDAYGPFRLIKRWLGKQYSTRSPALGIDLKSGILFPASPHQMGKYYLHRLGILVGDPFGIPAFGTLAGAAYLKLATEE